MQNVVENSKTLTECCYFASGSKYVDCSLNHSRNEFGILANPMSVPNAENSSSFMRFCHYLVSSVFPYIFASSLPKPERAVSFHKSLKGNVWRGCGIISLETQARVGQRSSNIPYTLDHSMMVREPNHSCNLTAYILISLEEHLHTHKFTHSIYVYPPLHNMNNKITAK